MNISEIQEKLEQGDIKRLHHLTGYSERHIKYVLKEQRQNEIIEQAAAMLVSHRELSDEIIKTSLNKIQRDRK